MKFQTSNYRCKRKNRRYRKKFGYRYFSIPYFDTVSRYRYFSIPYFDTQFRNRYFSILHCNTDFRYRYLFSYQGIDTGIDTWYRYKRYLTSLYASLLLVDKTHLISFILYPLHANLKLITGK